MKKEEFIKLGIDEELAKKCETASLEELKGYIPKTRFDEVNNEKKKLELDLRERNTQLEDLKNSTGDVVEMKKRIETLQSENKEKEENYAKEIKQLKLNNAIDMALGMAKAKNTLAVKALLKDMDKADFTDDGKIKGLDEQIKALKESDSYLFEDSKAKKVNIKGAAPCEGTNEEIHKPDMSKMSYEELTAYMENNTISE